MKKRKALRLPLKLRQSTRQKRPRGLRNSTLKLEERRIRALYGRVRETAKAPSSTRFHRRPSSLPPSHRDGPKLWLYKACNRAVNDQPPWHSSRRHGTPIFRSAPCNILNDYRPGRLEGGTSTLKPTPFTLRKPSKWPNWIIACTPDRPVNRSSPFLWRKCRRSCKLPRHLLRQERLLPLLKFRNWRMGPCGTRSIRCWSRWSRR